MFLKIDYDTHFMTS